MNTDKIKQLYKLVLAKEELEKENLLLKEENLLVIQCHLKSVV